MVHTDWKKSWRPITERIRTYHVPPAFAPGTLLEGIPFEISAYPTAFVSRREIVNERDGVKFDSPSQWYSRGAIYDSQRVILREFAEPSDAKFDNPLEVSAQRVSAATRVRGKCIYLGILHGHFGHFLVESLPRAWALLQADKEIPVLFQYAPSTRGQLFPDPKQLGLPRFISIVFEALGIGPGRLILANEDLLVDELLVPRAQFRLGKHGIGSTGLGLVYDHIREELRRQTAVTTLSRPKLYLTRTKLSAADQQKRQKSVANEQDVEALFRARGFEVVAPEQIPFEEQIALVSNATHIAGTTGSALHMILFNGRPDAQVIAVDWRNSRTQYILEAARGLRADHIYCFNGRSDGNRPRVDVEVVNRALVEIFEGSLRPGIPAVLMGAKRLAKRKDSNSTGSEDSRPAGQLLSSEWVIDVLRSLQHLKSDKSIANYQSLTIWGLLTSIQNVLGAEGDVLETSLNVNNQLFGLLTLKAEEKTLFVGYRHTKKMQPADFPEELQRRAEFLELSGQGGWADLQKRRFRWIHIDVKLSYLDLRRDIARLAELGAENGILVVDKLFDAELRQILRLLSSTLSLRVRVGRYLFSLQAWSAWSKVLLKPNMQEL